MQCRVRAADCIFANLQVALNGAAIARSAELKAKLQDLCVRDYIYECWIRSEAVEAPDGTCPICARYVQHSNPLSTLLPREHQTRPATCSWCEPTYKSHCRDAPEFGLSYQYQQGANPTLRKNNDNENNSEQTQRRTRLLHWPQCVIVCN